MNLSTPVHVSIPVSVAADLDLFKSAMGSILDKLGCQACCSGNDIHFELQRDILVNSKLGSRAEKLGLRSLRTSAKSPAVRAEFDLEATMDIKDVNSILDMIADLTGCRACCSGLDLHLDHFRHLVLDQRGAVT